MQVSQSMAPNSAASSQTDASATQTQVSFQAFGRHSLTNLLNPRKASKRSLVIAFRQLSLLVETGVDVAEALELVAGTCKQGRLQDCFDAIYDDISKGNSLTGAVNAQKDVLGAEITASIQAGEASGRLVDVLRQIADQLEEELQIRATITGALAYPAILGAASIAVAGVLIWFVLPQFSDSFAAMAVDPPVLTEILLSGSEMIRENVLFVLLGIVLTFGGLAVALMQPVTKLVLHQVSFYSPLIGPALRNLTIGRLFVRLGHLLTNGISLLDAIRLVRSSTSGSAVDQLTATWEHDVLEGKSLSQSLDQFSFLPEGADAMLIMAERTGKLDTVLTTAGNHYRNEGSSQLKTVLKLSEPIIIILLGGFVGMVVASVLLPIMDVQSAGSGG